MANSRAVTARRVLLASLACALAGTAAAQPPPVRGQGGPPGQGGPAGRTVPDAGAALGALLVFTAAEQTRIREWFIANPYPVQPLPPGIARNLARGKPLPPGIAKRYAPAGLIRQLPPRPGYEILVAGASILLVHAATGIVHDILTDVIRSR